MEKINSGRLDRVYNKITLEIDGFNQMRLINSLRNENITVYNMKKVSNRIMRITVQKADSIKTFAILKELCYNYTVIKKSGVLAFLIANILRVGIVAGLIVGIAAVIFVNGFILRVDITGLDKIPKTDMLDILADCGIRSGIRVAKIDRDEIRKTVNAIGGVAECSIEIKGNALKIVVIESEDYFNNNDGGRNVVSGFDAEVTSLITTSGTAKVQRGQYVKQGDILIEGMLYDTAGEPMAECAAVGTVYGRVVKNVSKIVPTETIEAVKTGKTKRQNILNLFGLKIGKNESPFVCYETKVTTSWLKGLIPIRFTHYTYDETEIIRTEKTPEQIVVELKETEMHNYISLGAKDVEVTERAEDIGGGLCRVNIYISGEIIISKTVM